MAFVILLEAIPRLFAPEGVDAGGMLIIALIGIVFKSISVYRLHRGETFNEKAILFHQLGDVYHQLKAYQFLFAPGKVICHVEVLLLRSHFAVFIHELLQPVNVYVVPFILPHVPLSSHHLGA